MRLDKTIVAMLLALFSPHIAQADIIREDTRIPVKSVRFHEYGELLNVGQIRGYLKSDPSKVSICTGTLIDNTLVATAAHCLIDARSGRVFDAVVFHRTASNYLDDQNRPINQLRTAIRLFINMRYLEQAKRKAFAKNDADFRAISRQMARNDIAFLEISSIPSTGSPISWGPPEGSIIDMRMWSYPGDKPVNSLWYEECYLDPTNFPLGRTSCDTWPGSSGAGVYTEAGLIGVNSAETKDENLVVFFREDAAGLIRLRTEAVPYPDFRERWQTFELGWPTVYLFAIRNRCTDGQLMRIRARFNLLDGSDKGYIEEHVDYGSYVISPALGGPDFYYRAWTGEHVWQQRGVVHEFAGHQLVDWRKRSAAKQANPTSNIYTANLSCN